MRASLVVVSLLAVTVVAVAWMGVDGAEAHDEAFTPPRWEIHRAELAVGADETGPARSAVNTLLLDKTNGQTWLLWPTEKAERPYMWVPVPRGVQ